MPHHTQQGLLPATDSPSTRPDRSVPVMGLAFSGVNRGPDTLTLPANSVLVTDVNNILQDWEARMGYFDMVEEAWRLSDAARQYAAKAAREVNPDEIWEKVFAPSPTVDGERTRREGGAPVTTVFLKSPYGLRYRADLKDWIPFRHGPIDLTKENA